MATIKAYTDLEQSKKLTEILSLESADMSWQQIYDENHMMSDYRVELIPYRLYSGIGVPCWSLAALLDVLPEIQGGKPAISLNDNYITYPRISDLHAEADNLVDACYELILKLHELKML